MYPLSESRPFYDEVPCNILLSIKLLRSLPFIPFLFLLSSHTKRTKKADDIQERNLLRITSTTTLLVIPLLGQGLRHYPHPHPHPHPRRLHQPTKPEQGPDDPRSPPNDTALRAYRSLLEQ